MHQNKFESPCTLCSAVAYCCGAVAPRAIAALLGRFLPRLGPLVHSGGPFFLKVSFLEIAADLAPTITAIIPLRPGTALTRPAEAPQAHQPEPQSRAPPGRTVRHGPASARPCRPRD